MSPTKTKKEKGGKLFSKRAPKFAGA